MRLWVSCTPFGSGVSRTIVIIARQIVDMRVSPSVSLSRGTYSAPGFGTYRVREYEVDSFSRGFAALNTAMSTTCWPSRSVTRRCWPARTVTARPCLGGITCSNTTRMAPRLLARPPGRERVRELAGLGPAHSLGIDDHGLAALDLHRDGRLLHDAAVGGELHLAVERLDVLLVELLHEGLALLLAERRRQAERLDGLLLGHQAARRRGLDVVRRVAVLLPDRLVELRRRAEDRVLEGEHREPLGGRDDTFGVLAELLQELRHGRPVAEGDALGREVHFLGGLHHAQGVGEEPADQQQVGVLPLHLQEERVVVLEVERKDLEVDDLDLHLAEELLEPLGGQLAEEVVGADDRRPGRPGAGLREDLGRALHLVEGLVERREEVLVAPREERVGAGRPRDVRVLVLLGDRRRREGDRRAEAGQDEIDLVRRRQPLEE